ncbi:MAG: type II secretion system protein GspC [Bacillota bacterium]
MEAVLRRWATPLQHAAPSIVSVLLVLLLAWLLADLTWSLVPQRAGAGSVSNAPPPTLRANTVDAGRIADRHLFGVASVTGNAQNAPDTTLALTLHGIVAGRGPADSRALIVANGDEEPYEVGASLPGGAVIRAIYPDRVLLESGGRVEALRLPKDDSGGSIGPSYANTNAMQPASPPPQPNGPPQNLGQLRQQISANPERLMDAVRAMPVMEQGKLSGYRIYPAGNPSMFNQLGLKPGDVVTAVNGIPLTDPAQSMRILASVKTADQVSITLLRNGQPMTQVLQMQDQGQTGPQPPNQPPDDNP